MNTLFESKLLIPLRLLIVRRWQLGTFVATSISPQVEKHCEDPTLESYMHFLA